MHGLFEYIPLILFVAMLVVIAVIDARRRKIYNWEICVLVALWVVWAAFEIGHGLAQGDGSVSFANVLWMPFPIVDISVMQGLFAAVAFGGGTLVLTLVFERLSGNFAFGGGDIKLLFAIGLFLGIEREAIAVMIACVVFAVIALVRSVLLARNRPYSDPNGQDEPIEAGDRASLLQTTLPFGPFIALGAVISLLV